MSALTDTTRTTAQVTRPPNTRRPPRPTWIRQVLPTLVAALIAIGSFLPLWWALASSLRPENETFATLNPVSWRTFIPESLTFANFAELLSGDFTLAMANSVLVAIATVIGGSIICTLGAFALSALSFRGAGILFAVIVISFLIPFDAIAVPLYQQFRTWDLQDTYAGLILPGIGNGLAVFMLRQFFLGIPKELAEAARVDGLGWFGILWRIYLPLSRPALIGAGVILFVFQWQSYLWPLLIAPSPDRAVAPVAIAKFAGQFDVDFGLMFAGTVLTAIVPLVLVLIFQKQFTESLAATGSKE